MLMTSLARDASALGSIKVEVEVQVVSSIKGLMVSLSGDKQADIIDAFNTSRYLDDIFNIKNVYLDNIVSQIYPSELQLNKTNTSNTEATFLDLHLSISNDIVYTKIYDKRDDFDIVNSPFLDGDVPRFTSYGV